MIRELQCSSAEGRRAPGGLAPKEIRHKGTRRGDLAGTFQISLWPRRATRHGWNRNIETNLVSQSVAWTWSMKRSILRSRSSLIQKGVFNACCKRCERRVRLMAAQGPLRQLRLRS